MIKQIISKMDQWMIVMVIILSFFCLGQEASNNQMVAYVSGMAEFKCHFNNPKNISPEHLVIYWQKKPRNGKDDHYVVGELFQGKRKSDNINENYINRTIKMMPNGDLQMFNITLEDEGDYFCYVLINKIEKEHNADCKLNVLANFSVPEINPEGLVKNDTDVTFHCSSTDGFPKPWGITWMVYDENKTQSHHQDCKLEPNPSCNIKKNSQTFNISSNFTLKVTSNISVTCTVLAHHNFSSKKIDVGILRKLTIANKENDNLMYILAFVTLIVVIIIGGGVYFGCKKYGKTFSSRSTQDDPEALKAQPPDNDVTQQPEENTSFIEAEANVVLLVTSNTLI